MTHPRRWVLAGLCLLSAAQPGWAETVTSWTLDEGTPAISGTNTSTVVVGTGNNNSVGQVSLSGSLSGVLTLLNAGDVIAMSGSLTLAGITNGGTANDLAFGMFDDNGSANATGWLGYSVSNADGSTAGVLRERNLANTTIYSSTTGTTSLTTATATGNAGFTSGTYSFSITLTRQAANALLIQTTLTRTSSAGYTMTSSFTDTTVNTFSYDHVGFFVDTAMKADQFSVSGVNVVYTPIPEPGVGTLLTWGVLGLCVWRRRARRVPGW